MRDRGFEAQAHYNSGIDPIDYAEGLITYTFILNHVIATNRRTDPAAMPWYGASDLPGLCRRIIGELLDAGWQMPDVGQTE